MLKQPFKDGIKHATQDMADAKISLAESSEGNAAAEDDVALAAKTPAEDTNTLADLNQNCVRKARGFEAATESRAEEVKAFAAAKKVILVTAGGAVSTQVEAEDLDSDVDLTWMQEAFEDIVQTPKHRSRYAAATARFNEYLASRRRT
eukprot:TRINITY_DN51927_c0_g1_i1.p1 TRINITY_DN51927_c0_g1~~TRINITY_DN51927_c0_g1_i1.p1  ORF type:complete len:148 (-),score=37.25 TRINITY_DN51927_c0_g1_i1:18-461(-)